MNNLKSIFKPIAKAAAHRALIGRNRSTRRPEQSRFSRVDVDHLLDQLWQNFDELAPGVPPERTFGARMNVMFACATLSGYQALLAAGIERDEAIDLISDITWVIYKKWGLIPQLISWILTRDPLKRLRICTNLFRRFPFNPPGYVMQDIPANDVVAFEVRRCPVAEYLRSYGANQLCVAAWCNLDYALAEMWGGKLERSKTIAAGEDRCDFRWKPLDEH
jgi:L-2-amino-thiazoline-4-carboxylic acid hydrolase-like protein